MKKIKDKHRQKAIEKFDWPCDKRIAHGPHQIDDFDFLEMAPLTDGLSQSQCPGVLAHPAVMIGRQPR